MANKEVCMGNTKCRLSTQEQIRGADYRQSQPIQIRLAGTGILVDAQVIHRNTDGLTVSVHQEEHLVEWRQITEVLY